MRRSRDQGGDHEDHAQYGEMRGGTTQTEFRENRGPIVVEDLGEDESQDDGRDERDEHIPKGAPELASADDRRRDQKHAVEQAKGKDELHERNHPRGLGSDQVLDRGLEDGQPVGSVDPPADEQQAGGSRHRVTGPPHPRLRVGGEEVGEARSVRRTAVILAQWISIAGTFVLRCRALTPVTRSLPD